MGAVESNKELSPRVLVRAAELIREKGFDATSVNELSAAVGLTKGGLYHYIKGKRDLLYRIMRFAMQTLESREREVAEIEDPEEQLRTLIRLHVQAISNEKGALTALSEEVQALDPPHRREILRYKRRYYEFVRSILERLAEQDRLRDGVSPSVAAFSILGMVLFFARWYREDGPLDPQQVAEQMGQLALGGILRPGSRAR